jgi:ribosomal protein S18 acetylase RimI-like enzyme
MIRLLPMTQLEFEAFLERDISEYAAEHVKAGNWAPAEALARSRQEHQKLLPQGLSTPNQHLYTIRVQSDGEGVGTLWLAVQPGPSTAIGFVYQLSIAHAHQRQGYGTQAMNEAEAEARRLGCGALSLHVFGHNQAAIGLYQKLGYEVTSLYMAKKLQSSPG